MLGGFALFVLCLVPPLRRYRETGHDPEALPPEWLSGYLLLAVASALVGLSGSNVVRGAWWGAAGRIAVAVVAAYAGARLVLAW